MTRRTRHATDDGYPAQADDEDDPAPIPWSHRMPSERPATRHHRTLAWVMLALGCAAVALGLVVPGTVMGIALGGFLLLFGYRVLFVK